MSVPPLPDARAIRSAFDATRPGTVGLEEEVMLLDARTFAPVPLGREVVDAVAHPSVKPELPAAQVELVTDPFDDVDAAVAALADARRRLLAECGDAVVPAAAAVHPAAPAEAELNRGGRYDELEATYGSIARRQLLGSLQVHVALGCADRTLAVYNALRGELPLFAALAAAAPFHVGVDTGLASVRPLVAGQLPRQGVPPAIPSWEAFADDLAWGAAAGTVTEPRRWWWELRPHVVHGTLEVRVLDVQPTVEATLGVTRFVVAVVRDLAARHDAGDRLPVPATWRIEENRWAALRDGTEGHLTDLDTGTSRPTREVLLDRIDEVEAHAPGGLHPTRDLVVRPTHVLLRAAGPDGAARWLAEQFSA